MRAACNLQNGAGMRFVALSMTVLTGCSHFVRGPQDPPCTRSYALPIVDGAVAASTAGLGAYEVTRPDLEGPAEVIALGLIVTGAIYAVSAARGATKVHACRAEP